MHRNIHGRSGSLVVFASLLFALSAAACASDIVPTGTVQMALTSVGSDGDTYRLRQAVLRIDGPTSASVDLDEVAADVPVFRAPVDPGHYTLTLTDGWALQRMTEDGVETVEATLISPNPMFTTVQAHATTVANLLFETDAAKVNFASGEIEVWLDVQAHECDPDDVVIRACGTNLVGRQERVCDDGRWTEWSACSHVPAHDDAPADDDVPVDAPDDAPVDVDTPDDADGDGFTADEDCDDTRADVFPGAPELMDGIDNDCNGMRDEEHCNTDADCSNGLVCYEPYLLKPGTTETGLCEAGCREPWTMEIDPWCGTCHGDGVFGFHEDVCERECINSETGAFTYNNGWCEWGYCDAAPCCEPSCDGRECGDDGCGGSCGECGPEMDCIDSIGICDLMPGALDGDFDGFETMDDCDDADPTIFPGAPEVADGQDNDCDGEIDEGMCVPDCEGRECGGDGCGGLCGSCTDGYCQPGGICLEGCMDAMGDFIEPGESCEAECNIDEPMDFFFADGVCMDNGECWAECFVWW